MCLRCLLEFRWVSILMLSNVSTSWPTLTVPWSRVYITVNTSLAPYASTPCLSQGNWVDWGTSAMAAVPPTRFESTQTTIFNVFASVGVFSTAFVLAPALFSSRVKRSRTWFGVLTSYLVYSAIYLLLVGRQFDPEPPLGLCFFQAALVYGIVPV